MPKKAPRNAFYFFMMDFRDEQRKKGINYENLQEVSEAASPYWQSASKAERVEYEQRAKQIKEKNGTVKKFTSLGQSYDDIDRQERMLKESQERELKYIQNFVGQNTFNKKILEKEIFLIDVNAYCETNVGFFIGECTLLRFSIQHGITNHYHWHIKSKPDIPIGYASDVKLGCEQHFLQYPDETMKMTDLHNVLAVTRDYLCSKDGVKVHDKPEPLYTMPEKVDQVQDFILQICERSVEDWDDFRVYKLDTLFFYLINALKNHNNEGFPKVSLATARLHKDAFKYTPHIGCPRHNDGDRTPDCTMSRVKRWAYTVLDSCCPVAGVEALPGHHVPPNIDIEAAHSYKEMKRHERRPDGTAASSVSSRDTSYLNDSYEMPLPAAAANWTRQPGSARELKPLRKPMAATLSHQKLSLPPELTESNFPALNLGSGRGAGRRTVADTFKQMNLNK